MEIGPVEYIIVGFPENEFKGEIVPELAKLVESGTVRILDLVFITKDADGNTAGMEIDDRDEFAVFDTLEGEVGGIISSDDIEHAAAALPPNSSAALLIWEDAWAAPFAKAVRNAGGVLLEGARIPHELITEALSSLSASD